MNLHDIRDRAGVPYKWHTWSMLVLLSMGEEPYKHIQDWPEHAKRAWENVQVFCCKGGWIVEGERNGPICFRCVICNKVWVKR